MDELPGRISVWGVVGGIGSGKSHVARKLARAGGTCPIDADKLGHEALRQPEVKAEVLRRLGHFSEGLLQTDGELNRQRLGELVFSSPELLAELEAVTHPWIRQRIREQVAIEKSRPGARRVVLDVALLLEAGWRDEVDRLIFVDAPDAVRLRRVLSRPGWTEKMWRLREGAQIPLTSKRLMSDDVFNNSGEEHSSDDNFVEKDSLREPMN